MSDDLLKRLREDQPVTQDMASTMQCALQDEAADRIEELEAKNEHAWNMVAKGDSDVIKAVSRNRELEAKLAKAVGQMQRVKDYRYDPNIGIELNRLEEVLAELKGGKDE